MKLTGLAISGVRGHTGTHRIAPVTLFTGRNGAGKTSRLVAIRDAVEGPRREAWTGAAQAALAFDAGTPGAVTLQRVFSPKHHAAVGGVPSTVKAVDAWAAANLGTGGMDVMAFLDMSPNAREAALLSLIDAMPDGWPTAAKLREQLGDALGDIESVCGPVPAGDFAAPSSWATWFGGAVKAANRLKLAAQREVKSLGKDLVDMAMSDAASPNMGTLNDAKAALAKADAALLDAESRERVMRELGGTVDAARAELDAMRAESAAIHTEIAGLPPLDLSGMDAALSAAESAAADAKAKTATHTALKAQSDRARSDVTSARRELKLKRSVVDRCRAVVGGFDSGRTCGECGQPVTKESPGYGAAVDALQAAESEFTAGVASLAEVEQVEAAAKSALEAFGAVPDVFSANGAVGAAQRAITAAKSERAGLVRSLEAKRATIDRSVAALSRTLQDAPADVSPEIAAAILDAAIANRDDARTALHEHQRAQAREEERAARVSAREAKTATVQTLTFALKRLKVMRGQLTRVTVSDVLADAQRLFGAVFDGELSAGDGNGVRLSIHRGGVDIPAAMWGDSELLVASLALSLSMQRRRGEGWRVALVNNVDRCDSSTLEMLLDALCEAANDGEFDNVVLAGAVEFAPVERDGLAVHVLGGE